MSPILLLLRTYAPYVVLPIACVVGAIGYTVENMLTDKYTPFSGRYIENYSCFLSVSFASPFGSISLFYLPIASVACIMLPESCIIAVN